MAASALHNDHKQLQHLPEGGVDFSFAFCGIGGPDRAVKAMLGDKAWDHILPLFGNLEETEITVVVWEYSLYIHYVVVLLMSTLDRQFKLYIYIYIYIYMCVCIVTTGGSLAWSPI